MTEQRDFKNFTEFYSFYLGEHRRKGTRILHFVGTSGLLFFVLVAVFQRDTRWLLAGAAFAYGFAWLSHFTIEKNRPATFKYPLRSLAADFVLFFDLIRGKEKFG